MPSQIGPWFDVRSFASANQLRDGSVDWQPHIQRAIDYIVGLGAAADSGTLYLPPGIYRIDQPLQVRSVINGTHAACSIHIVGDAPGCNDQGRHATTIQPDYGDKPALIIQAGRAVKIENIAFEGKNNWTSLIDRDPVEMLTHHHDGDTLYIAGPSIRDNRYSPYAAIHIDPYHRSVPQTDRYLRLENEYDIGFVEGSSDVRIESCDIRSFVVGIAISLNDAAQTVENVTVVDSGISSVKSAIAMGHSRIGNTTVRNLSVRGAQIVFDGTRYGNRSGSCPSVFGANVKGVRYVFQTVSVSGEVSVNGLHAEALYSIGMLGGGSVSRDGHAFSGCSFHFGSSPERKGAIVHRLANLTNTTFNACTFSLQGTEPIWIYNFYSLAFNQCSFGTNTPDVAPKLWINGHRERVCFNGTTVSMTPAESPAIYTGLLAVDYMRALYDVPMLPGTLFYSIGDDPPPPSLRWVPGQLPLIDLSQRAVSVPQQQDGTATFTVLAEAEGRVAPGDFIYALKPVQPIEYPYDQVSTYLVIGKVSAVSGKAITLAHVPKIVTSETLRLYATYVPRVHLPSQGTMDFAVSNTEITGMSHLDHWQQYERIRDQPLPGQLQGLIDEGAYITNDPQADGLVKLSRPAKGSGKVTLDLYDAEVWALSMTRV